MKYNVSFLQPALDDIEDIVIYIAKDSKGKARKLHAKIIEKQADYKLFQSLVHMFQMKR